MFPGLPGLVFWMFLVIAVGFSWLLLELTDDEDSGFDELDEDSANELDDSSSAGQFPPIQNVSESPGTPMSVILSPVLEPSYQRMAG